MHLDIQELISWKVSSEMLDQEYEYLKNNDDYIKKFHVQKPDMVSKFLKKVSVSSEAEYLITRLADANSYIEFSNPENQYKADLLKREIFKNLNQIEESDFQISGEQRLDAFCVMIKTILETNKITLKELIKHDIIKSIDMEKNNRPKLVKQNIFALSDLSKEKGE